MGVKLNELVEKHKTDFGSLTGKIIAIDAPNIIMGLFNFVLKEHHNSTDGLLLDRTQRPISHLYGLLYRVNFLYSKHIFPLFCFDGKDSELKRYVIKDRLNDFRFAKQWYDQAYHSGNKALTKQIALSREYLWQNILSESKQLLGALGVPFIESAASAESQCAQLVKDKIAHYSYSQDYDSLLFGCPHLLQNLSKSLKRKIRGRWTYQKIVPYIIHHKETLTHLNINQFQLVDMALMLKTDYFPGIHSIGPKTALKLIKQHNNIETIIQQEAKKYDFSSLTEDIIMKIRKIFLLPEVLTISDPIRWTYPNHTQIIHLLCEEHNLNRERVENSINKLLINFEKCATYFQTYYNKPRKIQTTLDNVL
jgi:flap endonuclease-1